MFKDILDDVFFRQILIKLDKQDRFNKYLAWCSLKLISRNLKD